MPRPLRVLHLEDSPRDAELVRHRLDVGGLDCDILLASGKDSFEAALAGEPFDLIISDYNLRGYDGITALKQAQSTQPDVPVILVSGTVGEEQAVKCLQIGATDYLLKARLERLVPAVQRALQESETRRQRKHAEQALLQREQALREYEKRTSFALAAARMGVWEIEFAKSRVTWSDTMAPLFGLTPETAPKTREDFFQLIHPDDRRATAAWAARAVAGERDHGAEFRAIWPDGSAHWILGRAQASYGADGKPLGLLGIAMDITARKLSDETRARLAAIVDSSDDAIFSATLDDTILTWNAGAERLYGYPASEVIGRSRAFLVPPGKSAELFAAMSEKAARGEPGEPFETQRRRKDGSVIDISLTISPMTDPTGRVTGMSTIARDITSRKKAETELKRLVDEIQLQRLRVFKATIRTVQDIVNNLLNAFQLVRLEAEGQLPAEMLTLVDRMIEEAALKLRTLGDLETVKEREMTIGLGIDYPGSEF
jgi:sigma-B regulation protein RsbU (phosphoserine phosphatase)